MTVTPVRVSPDWLSLREPADAAARAHELVGELRRRSSRSDRWLIHDLGAGTGAMGRWLAPLLPGRQHWILHDRDAHLLTVAAAHPPVADDPGIKVTVETRRSDITRLQPRDFAGATLITASALLDILTEDELARLISACVAAACPLLLTLSVIGRVDLSPADPLDRRVATAFDAHQRRLTERGRLLGPDAPAAADAQLRRLGAEVLVRPSAWRLGAAHADLAREWFTGWVSAACEQEPGLSAQAELYGRRRLEQAAGGELSVTVGHVDLLASPR